MSVSCECSVFLFRADHSSRGFLPHVAGPVSVIVNPLKGGHDPESGPGGTGKKNLILYI
jgi:hypothetical protein